MVTLTFDAHEQLVKHDYDLENITSKKDIDCLELNLKRDIKELELKLESRIKDTELKIAETKAELIRWVVGVGLLQITIIAGLIFRLTGNV